MSSDVSAHEARLRSLLVLGLAVFAALGIAHHAFAWDPTAWIALLPGCPFRGATGVSCPGCGSTRALALLAQLRLTEAVAMQPAAPLLVAASAAYAARPFRWSPGTRRSVCGAALAALLATWAARGLGILLPPLPL